MDLYLLRHGQAMFGSSDYDQLSDLGKQQALCLGRELAGWELQGATLVSGSLKRQRQTLAGVCEGGEFEPANRMDPGFNELEIMELLPVYWPVACEKLGLSMTPREASREMRYFLPLMSEALRIWIADHKQCQGESFSRFRHRVMEAIADHHQSNTPTLAVTSGGVISLVAGEALGAHESHMAELIHQVNNCSITHLKYARGQWQLQAFNVNGHLRRQDMLTWR